MCPETPEALSHLTGREHAVTNQLPVTHRGSVGILLEELSSEVGVWGGGLGWEGKKVIERAAERSYRPTTMLHLPDARWDRRSHARMQPGRGRRVGVGGGGQCERARTHTLGCRSMPSTVTGPRTATLTQTCQGNNSIRQCVGGWRQDNLAKLLRDYCKVLSVQRSFANCSQISQRGLRCCARR